MSTISLVIFAILSLVLVYGYAHEGAIAKFEKLLFTKRGRAILKKNARELLK